LSEGLGKTHWFKGAWQEHLRGLRQPLTAASGDEGSNPDPEIVVLALSHNNDGITAGRSMESTCIRNGETIAFDSVLKVIQNGE
jgi:hypothetical protein